MNDEDRAEIEADIKKDKMLEECTSASRILKEAMTKDPIMGLLTMITGMAVLRSIKAALILEGVEEHIVKAAEKRTQLDEKSMM